MKRGKSMAMLLSAAMLVTPLSPLSCRSGRGIDWPGAGLKF